MRRSCVSDRIVHEPDRFARMFPRLGPQLPHDFGQSEQSSRTPDSGIAETAAQMLQDRRARTAPTIPFGFLYRALLLVPRIGFIFPRRSLLSLLVKPLNPRQLREGATGAWTDEWPIVGVA